MNAVSSPSSQATPPRGPWSTAWRILVTPTLSRSFSRKERAGWTLVWAVLVGSFALTCVAAVEVEWLDLAKDHFSVPWALVGCMSWAVLYFVPGLIFDACDRRPWFAYLVYRVFEEIDPRWPEDRARPRRPSKIWEYLDSAAGVERWAESAGDDALRSHLAEEHRRLRLAIATLPAAAARDIRQACARPRGDGRAPRSAEAGFTVQLMLRPRRWTSPRTLREMRRAGKAGLMLRRGSLSVLALPLLACGWADNKGPRRLRSRRARSR
jgi:hypothetical protein